GELDLLAPFQRVLKRVEHHLDDLGGFLLGEPDFVAHAVDDVCLGHGRKSTRAAPTRSNPKGKSPCPTLFDATRHRASKSGEAGRRGPRVIPPPRRFGWQFASPHAA